ncbi:unnamed protein product, partial [Tetraodon nigroviridis]
VNFDHFQILRAIGKGSFGKVTFHFHEIDVCVCVCVCVCVRARARARNVLSVSLLNKYAPHFPEAYLLQPVYKFSSDMLCMDS